MKIKPCELIAIGAIASIPTMSAIAHHGSAGLFDETRTVEVTGSVKEWSFVNPHPILVLEVTDASGRKSDWDIYFGPSAASAMRKRGWSVETFKFGETIVVKGHPAVAEDSHGIDVFGADGVVTRQDGSPVP